MSCCSTSSKKKNTKRHTCPVNGKEYLEVPQATVLQHISKPWDKKLPDQNYYFCSDPDCDVVYFSEDNSSIKKSELRTLVGIKEPHNNDAMACYCFDVTHAEAKENKNLKEYVIRKTKEGVCSCDSRNPSGKCCLKDFLR